MERYVFCKDLELSWSPEASLVVVSSCVKQYSVMQRALLLDTIIGRSNSEQVSQFCTKNAFKSSSVMELGFIGRATCPKA